MIGTRPVEPHMNAQTIREMRAVVYMAVWCCIPLEHEPWPSSASHGRGTWPYDFKRDSAGASIRVRSLHAHQLLSRRRARRQADTCARAHSLMRTFAFINEPLKMRVPGEPSAAPAAEPPHAKGKGKGEKPTPMASEQWAPADDLVGMGLFMPRAPQDVLDLSPVADVRRSASALSSTSSTSEGTEKASGSKRRTREKPLRPDGKPTINLIFMGHVDAGKSTLNGHLLHLLKD